MPKITEISLGITIHIYNGDHLPPHFHAYRKKRQLRFDMLREEIIDSELNSHENRIVIEYWKQLSIETKNGFIQFFYTQNPSLKK